MRLSLICLLLVISGCYLPEETHYCIIEKPVQVKDFPYKGFIISTNLTTDYHVVIYNMNGCLWRDGQLHRYPCSNLRFCIAEGHYTTITSAMDIIDKFYPQGVNNVVQNYYRR